MTERSYEEQPLNLLNQHPAFVWHVVARLLPPAKSESPILERDIDILYSQETFTSTRKNLNPTETIKSVDFTWQHEPHEILQSRAGLSNVYIQTIGITESLFLISHKTTAIASFKQQILIKRNLQKPWSY